LFLDERSGLYCWQVRSGLALVVAAGDVWIPDTVAADAEVVIAADGGLANVAAAGLRAHVVVGDMDSVDPEALESARSDGATVLEHPADKDHSDLELALAVAAERARRAHAALAEGGRLDHVLANVAVLGSPVLADTEVDATVGASRAWVIRPGKPRLLPLGPGDHCALLALGGPAAGITTTGLRFGLSDGELWPHEARGIANRVTAELPTVSLTGGVLLALSAPDSSR